MKDRIYLDTSVISIYFDGRDAFLQQETRRFWADLHRYDVYVSDVVAREIRAAPEPLLQQMGTLVAGFYFLPVTTDILTLAQAYIAAGIFAPKKINDALHVAVATVHHVDYLVSWNFRDLVRVKTRLLVNLVNTQHDYPTVEIVAPSEL